MKKIKIYCNWCGKCQEINYTHGFACVECGKVCYLSMENKGRRKC